MREIAESARASFGRLVLQAMIFPSTNRNCHHACVAAVREKPVATALYRFHHNPIYRLDPIECTGNKHRRVALHASYHCCRCHYFVVIISVACVLLFRHQVGYRVYICMTSNNDPRPPYIWQTLLFLMTCSRDWRIRFVFLTSRLVFD